MQVWSVGLPVEPRKPIDLTLAHFLACSQTKPIGPWCIQVMMVDDVGLASLLLSRAFRRGHEGGGLRIESRCTGPRPSCLLRRSDRRRYSVNSWPRVSRP